MDQEKEVVKQILEVENKYHKQMMLLWQIARVLALVSIACFIFGWVWYGVGTGAISFVCFAISDTYSKKSQNIREKGVKYVEQIKNGESKK